MVSVCFVASASVLRALVPVRSPVRLVSPETVAFLAALREKIAIGVVGGSDLVKQKEQLGDSPAMFDWCFAENGLWAAKDGAVIGETSFKDHLGEEKLKRLKARQVGDKRRRSDVEEIISP